MVYNELEQGDILSEVRVGLASIAYADILLRSIWVIHKIRQTPVQKILFYAGRGGRDGLPGGVLQWSTAAGTRVTLRRRCLQCPIAGQGSTRFSHVMHPTAMDCLAGAPVLPS